MGNENLRTRTIGNGSEGIKTIVTVVHLDEMDIIVAGKALLEKKVYHAYLKREKESLLIPPSKEDKIKELIELHIGDRLAGLFGTPSYTITLEYAGKGG